MNANLLLITVTVVTMLWSAFATPAVMAQSPPGAESFQKRSLTKQVVPSGQEKLQRQWQLTVEKAYAQHAILEAWQQRVRFKQASMIAEPGSEALGQLPAMTRGR